MARRRRTCLFFLSVVLAAGPLAATSAHAQSVEQGAANATVGEGLNYQIGENFRAGVGLGLAGSDLDVGLSDAVGSLGYLIAPYGSYQINETFSVDLSTRFTSLFERDTGPSEPDIGLVDRESGSDQLYGALSLKGGWLMDAWSLGANIGTFYALNSGETFTDGETLGLKKGDNDVGRVNVGGRLGYQIDNTLEPYALALLGYDYSHDAGIYDDRVGLVVGLGLNVFTGANFTANFEGSTTQLRNDSEDFSVNAKIRLEF